MKVSKTRDGAVSTLRLSGEFDSFDTVTLTEEIDRCLAEESPRLLFDVAEVQFANSTAIACFLHAQRAAKAKGGGIAVARPNHALRKSLKILGLDQVLSIFDTREQAAAFLARG